MGASDRYITNQFVFYILTQSFKGASVGIIGGIMMAGFISGRKKRGDSSGNIPSGNRMGRFSGGSFAFDADKSCFRTDYLLARP